MEYETYITKEILIRQKNCKNLKLLHIHNYGLEIFYIVNTIGLILHSKQCFALKIVNKLLLNFSLCICF